MNKDGIMASLKVAELNKLILNDRKLFKVTCKVDLSSEMTSGSVLLIYSDVEEPRSEALVDTEFLEGFNVGDFNSQHDLIQFIGYKDPLSANEHDCKFKAVSFRIVSRTSLSSYYFALDTQSHYIINRSNKMQKNY